MQNNFIIRKHDDYLRAHITVLQPNSPKLQSEPPSTDITKNNPHKRPGVAASTKATEPT